jgi:hypothetical protein
MLAASGCMKIAGPGKSLAVLSVMNLNEGEYGER